jgi:phage antirepressor YoqD-like protein
MLHSPEFSEALIHALSDAHKENAKLTERVEEMAPKALYCDEILKTKNAVPISLIAKDYGMTAKAFNSLLYGMKIQYPISGTWLLYQGHNGKGYTKTDTYKVNDTVSTIHTKWTQKGRMFLYEALKERGITPTMERAAG